MFKVPKINDISLEFWIWDAICSIRGAKDPPKYKDYIFPIIFTKRLCNVFDDELNHVAAAVGSRKKVSSSQSRPQARPLLPPPRVGQFRTVRLVRHPQVLRLDRQRRHHTHAGFRPEKPAPAGQTTDFRPRRRQSHVEPRTGSPRLNPMAWMTDKALRKIL